MLTNATFYAYVSLMENITEFEDCRKRLGAGKQVAAGKPVRLSAVAYDRPSTNVNEMINSTIVIKSSQLR